MWVIVAAVLLIVVGVAASLTASRLNRQQIRKHERARQIVRERLGKPGESRNIDSILAENKFDDEEGARAVLNALFAAIGVRSWAFAPNATLAELTRVSFQDRGGDDGQVSDSVEPFTYDIVAGLQAVADRKAWSQRWESEPNLPNDEEGFANFVMSMTLEQLVTFFGPLVKRAK